MSWKNILGWVLVVSVPIGFVGFILYQSGLWVTILTLLITALVIIIAAVGLHLIGRDD